MSRSLLMRLEEFERGDVHEQYSLANFPPSFSSASCKSVLFDLAWDGIEYPDVRDRAKQGTQSWGLLSRLWG